MCSKCLPFCVSQSFCAYILVFLKSVGALLLSKQAGILPTMNNDHNSCHQ